jgi:hypothetical protein
MGIAVAARGPPASDLVNGTAHGIAMTTSMRLKRRPS